MKKLSITFWALVGVFFVVLGELFVPAITDLVRGPLFLLPLIIFSLLGIVLIVVTIKEKITGSLKKFLILTGASSTGFFVFVFLHNAFYALGVLTSNINIVNYVMEILHVTSFLVAIFICPLGFLIGIIGSTVLFIKKGFRF